MLSSLSASEQRSLNLDAASMLSDEVAWLSNFSPYTGVASPEIEQADNAFLAGHINVVRGLLSCEGVRLCRFCIKHFLSCPRIDNDYCEQVNRRDAGSKLLPNLLNHFLFPASKLIAEGLKRTSNLSTPANFNPKCSQPESRLAAYALIVELVTGCKEN